MSEPTGEVSRAQAAAVVAAARSTRLTGRAAVRAAGICAVAPSLAYPVREYIAQRQQIDQLLAQQQTLSAQVQALQQQDTKLTQTWYIEQQARTQLHMGSPDKQCYEVISGRPPGQPASSKQSASDPWYDKVLQSVKRADAQPGKSQP